VRLAAHKLSGLEVAVKRLSRAQFEKVCRPIDFEVSSLTASQAGMAFPPLEVKLLRSLPPHPNLMKLFDVVETQSEVYLIQEFVDGCELFEYCAKKQQLPELEAQFFFQQIVCGVSWLHMHGIAHRDLSEFSFPCRYCLIFLICCLFSSHSHAVCFPLTHAHTLYRIGERTA